MRAHALTAAGASVAVAFLAVVPAASAADDEVVRDFYTTFYGYPSPVEPGGDVTWYASGENAPTSTTDLVDIGWTSSVCGSSVFPGRYAPGEQTPTTSCTVTAPGSGELVNATTFRADVPAIGQTLVVDLVGRVPVLPTSIDGFVRPDRSSARPGERVSWTLALQNTGGSRLVEPGWESSVCPGHREPGPFPAGASTAEVVCTLVVPGHGPVEAVATFSATVPGTGEVVTLSRSARVDVEPYRPALSLSVTGAPDPATVGEHVSWTVRVRNTGDVGVRGVSWTGPSCVSGPLAELAPGAESPPLTCDVVVPEPVDPDDPVLVGEFRVTGRADVTDEQVSALAAGSVVVRFAPVVEPPPVTPAPTPPAPSPSPDATAPDPTPGLTASPETPAPRRDDPTAEHPAEHPAAPSTERSELPATGVGAGGPVVTAVVLLGAGAVLLAARRARRRV